MISIPETMVFANEKIFLARKTISRVNKKMISGLKTIVFVCHTKDFDTKTMVFDTMTIVRDTKTIVKDDI